MLAIIMAMRTLSTAERKRLTVVVLNHVRKFFNQDILCLPGLLLLSPLPYRISCSKSYCCVYKLTV